jgi:hypothetical protein
MPQVFSSFSSDIPLLPQLDKSGSLLSKSKGDSLQAVLLQALNYFTKTELPERKPVQPPPAMSDALQRQLNSENL